MSFFDDVNVWILDSSSLIRTKLIITVREQWNAFRVLESMVINGQIAMPQQVIHEVSRVRHPDVPGAWAIGMEKYLKHSINHQYLGIIQSKCPDLADSNKEIDDADPHVVALAYQLQEQGQMPCIGQVPCIVTEDKNNQNSQSIASACDQLNLKYICTRDFLTRFKIPTKCLTKKE